LLDKCIRSISTKKTMPRQARLNAPGFLQHVMARGVEQTTIFRDNQDRKAFLDRLAVILEESHTQCYAWALLQNHFHILLRTDSTPLSKVMRRLMTGYAVTFNRRYKRRGHLFQNRYKSVVCEEDPYLLELIRYIHLNPVRAGLVKTIRELDTYSWCGHSTILGKCENPLIQDLEGATSRADKSLPEQTVQYILRLFGDNVENARKKYWSFVKKGVAQGTRPDLQGGGLVRSAGGNPEGLLGRKKGQRENSDARILGSGMFVTEVIQKSKIDFPDMVLNMPSLEELTLKVANHLGLAPQTLLSKARSRNVSTARAIISYLAVKEAGYNQKEIEKYLNISRIGVRNSIFRGEKCGDICRQIWRKFK